MRINAYVLAADPAWIEASVLSYYDRVGRIVVSHDETSRGWTGQPVLVEQCLRRLRAIDRDGKLDVRPGPYFRDAFRDRPMLSETVQRQTALDQAGTDADWVLQLAAAEVISEPERFFDCVGRADHAGAEGLDFAARWLYRRLPSGRYLEQCRRGFRACAGYPGPMAVRVGATLKHARQGPERRYRVDFAARTTDPSYPRDTRIDEVIPLSQGILHFSWTRSDAVMDAKATFSSHAHDFNWRPLINKWHAAKDHPYAAVLRSQLERGNLKRHLRFAKISLPGFITERLPKSFDLATGEVGDVSDAKSSDVPVGGLCPRQAVPA